MKKITYFIALTIILLAFLYSDYGPGIFKDTHSILHYDKPTESDSFIESPTGLWLYKHTWEPEDEFQVKSLVFIVHGFGEHGGRKGYVELGKHLAENGNRVIAIDHQGHGKSTGDRGHIQSFNHYIEDLLFVIHKEYQEQTKILKKELPIFIYAHSMGTIVTLQSLLHLKYPLLSSTSSLAKYSYLIPHIKGTILSGCAMEVDREVLTPTVETMIDLFSNFVPKLPIDSIPASKISRSDIANEGYKTDPLILKNFLARWSKEYLLACDLTKQYVPLIDWPLLILHGGNDQIANVTGSYYIFNHSATPSDRKSLKVFDGALHELLEDDLVIAEFYELIDQFIDRNLK